MVAGVLKNGMVSALEKLAARGSRKPPATLQDMEGKSLIPRTMKVQRKGWSSGCMNICQGDHHVSTHRQCAVLQNSSIKSCRKVRAAHCS